ncbi:MAG: GHKL domain-containing protein [Gammaproteobacteria bacterium]|nr:GHKL domain-containing protein [Gammaproteobacteria bacterium]
MRSLNQRLGIGLALTLLLLALAQWWLVTATVKEFAGNYVHSRLQHDADSLLGALQPAEDGSLELNPSRINGVYDMPFSGHYYRVIAGDKEIISRSFWDFDLKFPVQADGDAYVVGPEGQQLLVVMGEFEKSGKHIKIGVAEDMTPLLHELDEFQYSYALTSLLVIFLVLIVQTMLVRGGLKPLRQVESDISRLERGEIDRLQEDVPTEIKPVVVEFNRLLGVMRSRLDRSRTAVGNLAHALKTPLTVLRRLADTGEMNAAPEVRDELVKQSDSIRQIVDRQLKRARMAGAAAQGWQFLPEVELPPLVDMMQKIYSERGLKIDLYFPEHFVFNGDREDMMELFGNLIDNACKWARGRVRLTIENQSGLVLTVEDDGPGCAPEYREQLSVRGMRVDESTTGHGLGLSIVRDIVEYYGGTLTFSQSTELGGFAVSVTLPGYANSVIQ